MKTSRQQILEYIHKQQLVTSSELSKALHMTSANVRHHLSILEQRGEIERVGHRSQPGKGRPMTIYGLSEQSKGNNLDRLCSALLDEISGLEASDQEQFLSRIAKRLTQEFERTPGRPSALTQRLYDTIQMLNQFRYQARWEAHHASPVIILEHCPYKSIIEQHPEICQMDAQLLNEMLGIPVEQTAKLAADKRGAIQCRFRLQV